VATFVEAPRGNVLAATGEFASSFARLLFKEPYAIASNQLLALIYKKSKQTFK
jgi:hypothetical protein